MLIKYDFMIQSILSVSQYDQNIVVYSISHYNNEIRTFKQEKKINWISFILIIKLNRQKLASIQYRNVPPNTICQPHDGARGKIRECQPH